MKLKNAYEDFQLDFVVIKDGKNYYNSFRRDCPKTFEQLVAEYPEINGKIYIENNVVFFKGDVKNG
jgi:tRNA uridine 5-carbamoylmethylation protein Kti12